jgi:hypothetical protein
MPAYDHPAIMAGRTIYPQAVRVAGDRNRWALKSGAHQRKIGADISKGRWKGFPIFGLSLEERATCPTSCHHWRSCFGNGMPWAGRIAAGPDLMWRLEREVAVLDARHPNGFAVRLHLLGDFYSVEYVQLWRELLERHSALHIFGYSARWQVETDPIAAALAALTRECPWDRFAMRFSNAPFPFDAPSTISVEHPYQVPADAVLCPEQIGRTDSCSTCGLCWQTKRRVAFLRH